MAFDTGPIVTENQFPWRMLVASLLRTHKRMLGVVVWEHVVGTSFGPVGLWRLGGPCATQYQTCRLSVGGGKPWAPGIGMGMGPPAPPPPPPRLPAPISIGRLSFHGVGAGFALPRVDF